MARMLQGGSRGMQRMVAVIGSLLLWPFLVVVFLAGQSSQNPDI